MPPPEFMIDTPVSLPPVARLLLAHSAGAPMTSAFMGTIAQLLAARGLEVLRFEFSYMAARRDGGKRRPPPKAETLIDEYRHAVAAAAEQKGTDAATPLLIGGKSMGGRVASLVADALHGEHRIAGLVCLGYPFHPTAKQEQLRTAHLQMLTTPALFVQGERDPFGSREEIDSYSLSPRIAFHWAGDGDHDLGPRGGKGFTRRGNLEAAADAIATFVASRRG